MFLLLIINIISFRLFFSRQMVLLPFRVFELVDLDAYIDGLVSGDAARRETDVRLTLNISAVHRSFAIYSLHLLRVLRNVDSSLRRPFSPQSARFPICFRPSVCLSSSFFLPDCSFALT